MSAISELVSYLDTLAPFVYQESYDNSGLLIGDPRREITGVLVALDCTEAVIDEAIATGANVVLTHHPVVFKGLKKLTGSNYVERTVIKAIENKIALIAFHTNLDNMPDGVNKVIADRLGLKNARILSPKSGILSKIAVFVPDDYLQHVSEAMFAAGAGEIGNYDSCGFSFEGEGTFRPLEGADPYEGEIGRLERAKEIRFEVIVPQDKLNGVLTAMLTAHPYEEVAYDLIALSNVHTRIGAGMVGNLEQETDLMEFLGFVKKSFGCGAVKYTEPVVEKVRRIAVCGGAGGFLLSDAVRAKADVFITADYKYHEYFDADKKIVIADIGHYESEQFTSELLVEQVKKKFTTFAVRLTSVNTNPVKYLI
jgi:dinuclear metal center YbgI/SA1388 family protein